MSATTEIIRERRDENLAAVLIATVTILIATTTFFQVFATAEAEEADRRAQQLSIQATTQQVSGAVQFSYDWQGAFLLWRDLGLQAIAARTAGDEAAALRAETLQAEVEALSPLLQPPFFDRAQAWPNSNRYEAELYLIESTILNEKFTVEAETGNTWVTIAQALVIQLTLYAAALALFGLSATVGSWIRWMFVSVGGLMVFVNIGWAIVLIVTPFPNRSDAAIEAYAIGVGYTYQGEWAQAIESYNKAIVVDPAYGNALYNRGSAFFFMGNYDQAVIDFQAARDADRDDTTVGWDLGWSLYLLGRYEESKAVNRRTLQLDPTLIGLRMNYALVLLTNGEFDLAERAYQETLDEAARQVVVARQGGQEPPSSLWFYLDAGATDLQGLVDSLNGTAKPWAQAPTRDRIRADPVRIQSLALELIREINEHTVALELTGAPPTEGPPGTVSVFRFAQEVLDANGSVISYDYAEVFPFQTNHIVIEFDYENIRNDQAEVWKIYQNGIEDPSLRVVSAWTAGSDGVGIKTISYAASRIFVFGAAEYTVHLYIDSQLLRSGTFWVQSP